MEFSDHFSSLATQYAAYRPGYPDELFAWLAEIAPGRKLVWDCACGSGQASRSLAKHFDRVIATDASEAQLAEAAPDPKIDYRVALAEKSGLESASADLITVAQAAHWFKLDGFYAEARRVAKPDAVLALWTYDMLTVNEPALMERLQNFIENVIECYWAQERGYVKKKYLTLPFPFPQEIQPPLFKLEVSWKLAQLLGYLGSWSAVKRYREVNGADPVAGLEQELIPLWGDIEKSYPFTFPLHLRVARL